MAAVIKETNENGEPIIFATQRGYGDFKGGWEFLTVGELIETIAKEMLDIYKRLM